MIAGAAPSRSCQKRSVRIQEDLDRRRIPLGGEPRTGDRPVHVAVEPFLGASKAVHAGKAEEVEDEARGSAMLAVYPCPVDTVLTLIPRNLLLSLQIGAFCRDFGGFG